MVALIIVPSTLWMVLDEATTVPETSHMIRFMAILLIIVVVLILIGGPAAKTLIVSSMLTLMVKMTTIVLTGKAKRLADTEIVIILALIKYRLQ